MTSKTGRAAMEKEHLALRMLAGIANEVVCGRRLTDTDGDRLAWIEVHLRPGFPPDSPAVPLLEQLSALRREAPESRRVGA